MNSLKVRSLNWAWGSWSTNMGFPPGCGLFEKSQIDLGNLLADLPVLLESFQTMWKLRKKVFGKIMHFGFPGGGNRQVVEISVSRIAGFVAMAILFPAAALAEFHKAALDHLLGELMESFLEEPFAICEYSRLLYHNRDYIKRRVVLSSPIARFFENLAYFHAIEGRFEHPEKRPRR